MKKKTKNQDPKKLVFKKEIISDFSQAKFNVSKEQREKLRGGGGD
jgi:hypothetical protein